MAVTADCVILEYEDLVNGVDLTEKVEKAFGYDGLGILAVRGVPGLKEKRETLLPLAHKYANLPEDVKLKTESPDTQYSFGWSHGKETLEGKPDYSKGSYFNNPQYDRPVEDEELIKKFPAFIHPNIWPSDDLPQLENAFKEAGQLMVSVGELIAAQCDAYVKREIPSYESNMLRTVIETSKVAKGRLLHYFPVKEVSDDKVDEENFSSWCGWHNDHGSLTALMSAMFMNEKGDAVQCPDERAGLYIRTRKGVLAKVAIPGDMLAFQIGETAQIHSGGLLQATPHAVRGAMNSASKGVSRETFAVFMEPNWDFHMKVPDGVDPDVAKRGSNEGLLPKGVPPLGSRWTVDMDFNDFTTASLAMYYK